jgi:tetratricopeptide (TPR) repeat protein
MHGVRSRQDVFSSEGDRSDINVSDERQRRLLHAGRRIALGALRSLPRLEPFAPLPRPTDSPREIPFALSRSYPAQFGSAMRPHTSSRSRLLGLLFDAAMLAGAVLALAVTMPAAHAAADDAATCRDASGQVAIAACTRGIDSGNYRGHALAALLHNRGFEYADKNDYDRAIADYSLAITVEPNYPQAFFDRGNIWVEKGDMDRALADYGVAIRLDPNYADAYTNRGNVWAANKDYDRAVADYSQAIRLAPQDSDPLSNRGNVWLMKGEFDRALADYNAAIRLDPKDYCAINNRGIVWHAKGDNDRAIADYNEAIRLAPNFARAYYNRAVAYGEKGDRDRAFADFNMAQRLDPGLPMASGS